MHERCYGLNFNVSFLRFIHTNLTLKKNPIGPILKFGVNEPMQYQCNPCVFVSCLKLNENFSSTNSIQFNNQSQIL